MPGDSQFILPKKQAVYLTGLCGVVVCALALGVVAGSMLAFDARFLAWVQQFRSYSVDRRVVELTALGSVSISLCFVLWLIVFSCVSNRRKCAVRFFVATATTFVVTFTIKAVVGRQRPEAAASMFHTASFPSGHAAMSVAAYLGAAYFIGSTSDSRLLTTFQFSTAAFLGIGIGLSRVYLGYHFASDVVAGWACGLFGIAFSELVASRSRTAGSPTLLVE